MTPLIVMMIIISMRTAVVVITSAHEYPPLHTSLYSMSRLNYLSLTFIKLLKVKSGSPDTGLPDNFQLIIPEPAL